MCKPWDETFTLRSRTLIKNDFPRKIQDNTIELLPWNRKLILWTPKIRYPVNFCLHSDITFDGTESSWGFSEWGGALSSWDGLAWPALPIRPCRGANCSCHAPICYQEEKNGFLQWTVWVKELLKWTMRPCPPPWLRSTTTQGIWTSCTGLFPSRRAWVRFKICGWQGDSLSSSEHRKDLPRMNASSAVYGDANFISSVYMNATKIIFAAGVQGLP